MNDNFLRMEEKIKESIPDIIETFVIKYGEENRTLIENTLKNVIILCNNSLEDVERELYLLDDSFDFNLKCEFLDKIGVQKSSDNISKYFCGRSFYYSDIVLIYKQLMENVELKSYQLDILNLYMNKNYTMDTISYDEVNEYFNNISPVIDEFLQKYEQYKNTSYLEHREYVKESEAIRTKLEDKYFDKYIDQIYTYLSCNDKSYIDNCRKNNQPIIPYTMENGLLLVNSDITNVPLIDSFTTSSMNLLEKNNWESECVKRNQIQYFRNLGIKHDTYEEYRSDDSVKSIIPSTTFADQIINVFEKCNNELETEFFCSTSNYKNIVAKLDSLNLVNNDYSDIFSSNCAISPSIIEKDGKYQMCNFFVINLNNSKECIDQYIFHELNHLIESTLVYADKNNAKMITGWDFVSIYGETIEKSNGELRKYELFSEVINELTAQDLHNIHLNRGKTIINTKEESVVRGTTNYEHVKPLILNFFEHFSSDIIKFRLSKDKNTFFDKVGMENFEALNSLINSFFSKFNGCNYYSLLDDIKAHKKTDAVISFQEFLKASDDIYNSMLDYEAKYDHAKGKGV